MNKLIVATVAALSALASMAYDTPLVLEVTGTESLTAALGGQSLAGHDALVKSGAGTLTIGSADVAAISSFDGDIVVSGGVLKISAEGALGTAAGKTVVENDAQLYIDSAASDLDFTAETMEISGEGPDGKGAIFANNKENNAHNFGSVKLVDDATIGYVTTCWFNRYNNAEAGICDLNGKTLTFKTSSAKIVSVYGTFTSGNVRLNNAKMILSSTATFQGTAENTLQTTNRGAVACNWYAGTIPLTLKPLETPLTIEIRNAGDTGSYNVYQGPVDLTHGNILVPKASDAKTPGLTISGKISGDHAFMSADSDNYKGITLALTNPENDFTGGVSINGSTLKLPVSGAMPEDGGPLSITDGTLVLGDAHYALPDAVFGGNSSVSGSGATGSWKGTLRKVGDGLLDYGAYVGSPVLDLQGGSVRIPAPKVEIARNSQPGLNGGSNAFGTSDEAKVAWQGSATYTNGTVYATPEMAYKTGTSQGWTANTLWTYDGYIWNRNPTNEVWTFASCILTRGSVFLDGVKVVANESPAGDSTKSWSGVKHGNVTVAPGAHRIQIRMHSASVGTSTQSGGGAYYSGTYLPVPHGDEPGYKWATASGIMLDRLGRESTNVVDYAKIVDSGDGELLTLTDTPDTVITTEIRFDTVVATNEIATLDVSGAGYTVANVVGFPAVVNCPNLTVTNGLVVGRGAYASKSMTADGKVTFGADAKVVVDFGGRFRPPSDEVTVLTAEGGIAGEPALELASPSRGEFSLRKSDDGKSLILGYKPAGMILILK